MKKLPSCFLCRHLLLCFQLSILLPCGIGTVPCQAEDMATEVATPLQEFKIKRLAIEKRAEAETQKELESLIKKLDKISKGKNKNPNAGEQAAKLLEKLKAPTFLATGLDELIDDTQVGVSIKGAEMIALAYRQRRVSAENWATLPGDVVELTMKEKQDTGIELKPGDMVLVCPHPTQTWRKSQDREWTTFDGRDKKGGGDGRQQLIARVNNPANTEVIEIKDNVLFRSPMEGRLYIESRDKSDVSEGAITCKVFKVTAR